MKRTLSSMLAALAVGAASVLGGVSAHAQEQVLVIGVTGGVYEDVQRAVFFEPFTKATGIVYNTKK